MKDSLFLMSRVERQKGNRSSIFTFGKKLSKVNSAMPPIEFRRGARSGRFVSKHYATREDLCGQRRESRLRAISLAMRLRELNELCRGAHYTGSCYTIV